MEEKQIDDIILEQCKNLSVVADAATLLEAEDDSYAMLRHIGFGASDSSKLLGINPFTTLNELLEEKNENKENDISEIDKVKEDFIEDVI